MEIFLVAIFCTVAVFQEVTAINLNGCLPGPKQVISLTSGAYHLYSPGYEASLYPNDLFCQWTFNTPITPSTVGRFKITFDDFDIDPFESCGKDMVEILDGVDGQSVLIGIFCGNIKPNPILTMSNTIQIKFRSDFLIGRRGFHMTIEVHKSFMDLCPFGTIRCRNRNCYKMLGQHCNGIDDCGDGTDEENCNLPVTIPRCGTTPITPSGNATGSDRVVGGTSAIPGSWPWQADLQLSYYFPNGHMCGGTLIHPQWVVSAAHCFGGNRKPSEWRIHLGSHKKYEEDNSEQIRYASRIIMFPGYTGEELLKEHVNVDLNNDVALVKLNAPVAITDQVQTACLPVQGQEMPAETRCMASGWGTTRGTGHDDVLKQVELTIKSPQFCNNLIIPIVPKTMVCVKNSKGHNDVCHGDSGGPLVCKMNNVWSVIGATSFGTDTNMMGGLCAMQQAKTVYAKISDKIDWINQMFQRYNNVP